MKPAARSDHLLFENPKSIGLLFRFAVTVMFIMRRLDSETTIPALFVFLVFQFGFGDYFLLNVWRHDVIMAEFHGIATHAASHAG